MKKGEQVLTYNCEDCENDMREQKEKTSKVIQEEIDNAKEKLKESQSDSFPGGVSLYWLGYSRALQWAQLNLESKKGHITNE